MYVLVAIGENDKFLGVLACAADEEALDKIVEELEPIREANIAGKLPLKKRLQLAPYYFPRIGRLMGFEYRNLEKDCLWDYKLPLEAVLQEDSREDSSYNQHGGRKG